MSGRPTREQVTAWADEVGVVGERIGRHLARSGPRRRAVGYVRGLLSGTERKNGWPLAEHLGDPTPDGVPHLLARAGGDADAARDDLLGYAREHLGRPDGVPVVDETGFRKKGTTSCGVARQDSGTAGRIANCQIGVFLGYTTAKGRALIDRVSYRPKEWAHGADRRAEAGVPGEVAFATTIVPARRTSDRAVAAGLPAKWVADDAVYGSDYHSRTTAEGHGLGYVVGVRADCAAWAGFRQVRVRSRLDQISEDGWARISGGAGSKGPRVYDRARFRTPCPGPGTYARRGLIRRSVTGPGDVAYFACGGPPNTAPDELVRVAGARRAIEDLFELAKGDCGVGEYEVRSGTGWHRHVTPSLFALAVVAVIRSRVAGPAEKGARGGSP